MAQVSHTDVAAYVLGALDEPENAAFEAHLLDCAHCQLELLELHELPELLDEVRRTWPAAPAPPPGPRVLDGLLAEAAAVARKRRRVSRWAAAAAVLVFLAGSILSLSFFLSGGSPGDAAPVAAPAETPVVRTGSASGLGDGARPLGRTDAGTPVTAKVVLRARDWGTQAELELSGVTGPIGCALIAVPWLGDSPQILAGWTIPAKGYGVPGSPEPLRVSGATALNLANIQRLEVRAENGTTLVTVAN
ncbi:zf-HC2 domain-containing protein [Amycolatopsis anabasis]|uniref:zf-HC2 domain-containing protein n=1 Tax=Amycolatopsis anabasis TaxID=1840409 RepID=UPI00131BD6A5|nr:zf-HC2 domain-containing protein [Amycolatopsis anabasis]